MKFLREFDETCHRLSSIQADLFSLSRKEKVASYTFIKCFSYLESTKSLDDLSFLYGTKDINDIYRETLSKIKNPKRGKLIEEKKIHWIGYFYRTYCYLTGHSSKQAFKEIPVKYLEKTYYTHHSLDITQAVKWVIDSLQIKNTDPLKKILNILSVL